MRTVDVGGGGPRGAVLDGCVARGVHGSAEARRSGTTPHGPSGWSRPWSVGPYTAARKFGPWPPGRHRCKGNVRRRGGRGAGQLPDLVVAIRLSSPVARRGHPGSGRPGCRRCRSRPPVRTADRALCRYPRRRCRNSGVSVEVARAVVGRNFGRVSGGVVGEVIGVGALGGRALVNDASGQVVAVVARYAPGRARAGSNWSSTGSAGHRG